MTTTRELDAPTLADTATDQIGDMLAGIGRLGVAFSGGVDSSVLLALAARALGADRVLAILGVSPSLATDERTAAHDVARFIGVPLVEVTTHEGDLAAYRANGPDRCFHCKDELFTRISDEVVQRLRLDAVAYGENADDARRPDRPGSRAAPPRAVPRPRADLCSAARALRGPARQLGLPNHHKPASPCLDLRLTHFSEVDPVKLAQVEAAEAAVLALGFADCRGRHHGDVARVELLESDLDRVVVSEVRRRLVDGVRAAGFRFVTVDLAGIQSGAFTLPLVSVSHG